MMSSRWTTKKWTKKSRFKYIWCPSEVLTARNVEVVELKV
jgi:hypothetical protein